MTDSNPFQSKKKNILIDGVIVGEVTTNTTSSGATLAKFFVEFKTKMYECLAWEDRASHVQRLKAGDKISFKGYIDLDSEQITVQRIIDKANQKKTDVLGSLHKTFGGPEEYMQKIAKIISDNEDAGLVLVLSDVEIGGGLKSGRWVQKEYCRKENGKWEEKIAYCMHWLTPEYVECALKSEFSRGDVLKGRISKARYLEVLNELEKEADEKRMAS